MEIKQTDRPQQIDPENHPIQASPVHSQAAEQAEPISGNMPSAEMANIESTSMLQSFTCKICCEDKSEVFTLPICSHSYCYDCISDYLTIRIQEAQVLKMPCPDHECGNEINEQDIKKLVSNLYYEKYLVFKRNTELSNNPFLKWCPQPDCTGYDLGNINKDHLVCSVCTFEYCYYCSESWHPSGKCKQKHDRDLDQWSQKNNARFCPNCRIKVQKTIGCDHMTCTRCKYEWCWLCGEEYKVNHAYKCRVIEIRKWDKPLFRIALWIFSSIILILLPVFVIIAFVYETDAGFNTDASFLFRCFKKRFFVYLFAVFSGIVFLPFYLSLAPIVVGTIIMYKFFKEFSYPLCIRVLISPLFGCVVSPLVPCVALVVVLAMMMYGLFFLIIKIAISLRRCFNPMYMIANTKYRPVY